MHIEYIHTTFLIMISSTISLLAEEVTIYCKDSSVVNTSKLPIISKNFFKNCYYPALAIACPAQACTP